MAHAASSAAWAMGRVSRMEADEGGGMGDGGLCCGAVAVRFESSGTAAVTTLIVRVGVCGVPQIEGERVLPLRCLVNGERANSQTPRRASRSAPSVCLCLCCVAVRPVPSRCSPSALGACSVCSPVCVRRVCMRA